MTWTTPGALWLLLSVPVLLWLEWRQRQRRIVPVATLALWRAVGSGAETARSDRRRWTLGTLLRVLAITAIAAAAAGPRGAARAPSPVVTLVIDASAASDWRGDDGRSALARSIEAAMSETLPTGAVPRYLIVPGDGAPVARPSRSELAGVTSTDLPLDWNVAIDAVLASAEAGPIHVYTPSAGPQRPGVTWHVMGSREGNAGITSLRLEETSDSGPRAFVRVRRIGEMSPEIEVELSVDDISREVKTITLEDGESRLVGFESEVTGSPVTVSLRPGGALSSDDRAWAFRTLSRPAVRIGVRAPEAVARAVRAAGLADVEIGESDSLRSGTAWIGLTDRPTPGPELVLLGAESGERVSVPGGVLTPEVGSALFRGVALAPLLVSSVREWPEGSSAEVVAWIEGPSDRRPAIVRSGSSTRVLFELTAWARDPSFPIFVSNWIESWAGQGPSEYRIERAGDPWPPGTGRPARSPNAWPFPEADPTRPWWVGRYRFASGERWISLLDADTTAKCASSSDTIVPGAPAPVLPEEVPDTWTRELAIVALIFLVASLVLAELGSSRWRTRRSSGGRPTVRPG